MGRVRAGAMVGRDGEFAALLEAFAAGNAGEAQVALVTGEAGIGKSRLVREFSERLPGEATVAVGHAVPLAGGALPYGLVTDLLRSLVGELGVAVVREALGQRVSALAGLVPRLAQDASPVVDRLDLFGATQDMLSDVSRERMVVLVAEDAHWADESSLEVLVFWARTLVRGRLLLVITSRDAGAPDKVLGQLGELRRLPNATSLALVGLDADGVEVQVGSLDASVTPADLERIVTLSDGVPLYVEELVGTGLDTSVRGRLPDVVELDLNARLESLDPSSADVLRQGALESRPFEYAALASVTSRAPAELDAAIKHGVDEGILDHLDGNRWRFHHELLRQAAADSMPPSKKISAHRRWAERLGRDPAAKVADLVAAADHWVATGLAREAYTARVRAARAVRRLGTTREAGAQWLAALTLLHRDVSVASEAEYDDVLAAAVLATQNPGELLAILAAEERAARVPRGVRGHWMSVERFCLSHMVDDVHAVPLGPAQVHGMLTELERVSPSALAARAVARLVEVGAILDLPDHKARALDLLEAMSATVPDEQTRAAVYIMEIRLWDIVTQDSSRVDEMAQLVEQALAASADLDSLTRAWTLMRLAFVRSLQGQAEAGLACCLASLEMFGSPEADVMWYVAASGASTGLQEMGRWDEALTLARRCREPDSFRDVHNLAVATEFFIDLRRGTRRPLEDFVEMLVATLPGNHEGGTGSATRFFPQVFEAFTEGPDDPACARRLLRDFLEADDIDEQHYAFDTLVLATQLTWMTPPPDEDYLEVTRSAVKRATGGSPFELRCDRVTDAHLARAAGAETLAVWRAAVRAMDDQKWAFHRAQCRFHLAQALLHAGDEGDRDEAAEALAVGLTIAEQLGARPLADDIRSLAARARLGLPGHEPVASGDSGLTARELEVLKLLVAGHTNEQIGAALFISPRTASVHVSHILAKLGAANRTEVAAVAHRRGLVSV